MPFKFNPITNQLDIVETSGSGGPFVETLTGNDSVAVPANAAGNINTVGSGNITSSGNPGTNTQTFSLTGLTQHDVLVGGAGGTSITSLALTTNQVAMGTTGSDPSGKAFSMNQQLKTSTSTYTPTSGMQYCIVEVCGGGGGGGGAGATGAATLSAGSGGGAGGYIRAIYTASAIGASQSVTVNSGGAGGVGTGAGSTGGSVVFGALITCTGGSAGVSGTAATTGAALGGTGGTVTVLSGQTGTALGIPGQSGGPSVWSNTGLLGLSGMGGASFEGGGGGESLSFVTSTAATGGVNGNAIGAGGSGAVAGNSQSAATGGNGNTGAVLVTEFIWS